MIKNITLGQFFPGTSLLHKLDPRFKIILTVLYIVIIFLAKSTLAYASVLLFSILLIIMSQLPIKTILKSLKTIVIILIFTSLLNVFWTSGEILLVKFGPVKIYAEGIKTAVLMVIRIVSLLVGTSVILSYTTSPIMLTDGIERLLSPLKILRMPVHEFSLMLTIALRFIPTLIEETDKIMSAQTARGADFSSGSLLSRAKALIPVLIPLFVSSFRRADELATAMECRCYHGGKGRTKMNVSKIHAKDIFTTLFFVSIGIFIIFLNQVDLPGIL